jgi:hypothetical protein
MTAQLHSIIPKCAKRKYKQHPIEVTFIPSTKEWEWKVIYVQTTEYKDKAKTLNAAFKAAEKHIDQTLKIRGK